LKSDIDHDHLKGWELDLEDAKYTNLRLMLKLIGVNHADMWARGILVHRRKTQSYSMDLVTIQMIHAYMRKMKRKNQSVFVNELVIRGLISLSLEEEAEL